MTAAMYLFWSPVGSPVVHGLQGRYFLPFYWLAWLSIPQIQVSDDAVGRMRWSTLVVQMLMGGWAILVTFQRYWAV